MNSPAPAVIWAIWQRGRRATILALCCISVCALVNLLLLDKLTEASRQHFAPFFGLLMALSFLFLIMVFNYTEFNAAKDWHGFPCRLFTLPVPTWQLVGLPMVLAVVSVELAYLAWIKLVWTRGEILMPEWFAVILGAYVVFYQMALWSLAGMRVTRVLFLSFGGVSGVGLACLPFAAGSISKDWLSKERLMAIVLGLAAVAFLIAWAAVARQRSGGGRRRTWLKTLLGRLLDVLPNRTKDFSSPAAAQFWFEWQRTGWLLPVCIGFVVVMIMAPISWFTRADPSYVTYIFCWLLAMPFVLAFVIGKGFIKSEFWSTHLGMNPSQAVLPAQSEDFVVAKAKVAALSAAIAWLLVLTFLTLWLALWANTTQLKPQFLIATLLYPHSWPAIAILSVAACVVLTWRCMVSGLWAGLSGKRSYYGGSIALQVIVPALVLLAIGIWSDAIDRQIKRDPIPVKFVAFQSINWLLFFLVAGKAWFAAFSWSRVAAGRTRQYLALWVGGTLCFVTLAILAWPPFDTNRLGHLFLLAALWFFPLARLGLAPSFLAKNRHR